MAGGENEADRAAEPPDGEMDLGAQTAARAAEGLIFRPPFFAPEACWWALTTVESMTRYSKSGSSDIASKMRNQMPLRLQRVSD
jgi:hypothetical protein